MEPGSFLALDDTVTAAVQLTERQRALIRSALFFLEDRVAWNEMTDSQWDEIGASIDGTHRQLS